MIITYMGKIECWYCKRNQTHHYCVNKCPYFMEESYHFNLEVIPGKAPWGPTPI